MNSFAPDLSGLVPFMYAFIGVAVVGAVISLVIIGQSVTGFVNRDARAFVIRQRALRAVDVANTRNLDRFQKVISTYFPRAGLARDESRLIDDHRQCGGR